MNTNVPSSSHGSTSVESCDCGSKGSEPCECPSKHSPAVRSAQEAPSPQGSPGGTFGGESGARFVSWSLQDGLNGLAVAATALPSAQIHLDKKPASALQPVSIQAQGRDAVQAGAVSSVLSPGELRPVATVSVARRQGVPTIRRQVLPRFVPDMHITISSTGAFQATPSRAGRLGLPNGQVPLVGALGGRFVPESPGKFSLDRHDHRPPAQASAPSGDPGGCCIPGTQYSCCCAGGPPGSAAAAAPPPPKAAPPPPSPLPASTRGRVGIGEPVRMPPGPPRGLHTYLSPEEWQTNVQALLNWVPGSSARDPRGGLMSDWSASGDWIGYGAAPWSSTGDMYGNIGQQIYGPGGASAYLGS